MNKICLVSVFFWVSFVINITNGNSQSYDIVIVAHHKDYEILDLCIKSIKKNISAQRIFVIGTKEIISDSFIFVPEQKFYCYINPLAMKEAWKCHNAGLANRAFWIFQQLLKLGAHLIIPDLLENYLCIDADTIWLKPQTFIDDQGRSLCAISSTMCDCCKDYKSHMPYAVTYRKLLDEEPVECSQFSFICHHMLFNKTLLGELLQKIESIHHKAWYNAIFDNCDYNQPSTFSEYEMYGNWLLKYHKSKIVTRSLHWKDINNVLSVSQDSSLDFVAIHWFSLNDHIWGYPA